MSIAEKTWENTNIQKFITEASAPLEAKTILKDISLSFER